MTNDPPSDFNREWQDRPRRAAPPPLVPGPGGDGPAWTGPAPAGSHSGGNWTPPGRNEDSKPKRKLWPIFLVIGLVALGLACWGLVSVLRAADNSKVDPEKKPAATATKKADKPATLKTTVPDGTWTAGEDIKAGTYKASKDSSENCTVITQDSAGKALTGATGPGRPKFTVTNKQRVDIKGCPSFTLQP